MGVKPEVLHSALAKVRTSILLDYGELFGNEERCRQRVIDPILSALGWDIFSDEVVVEHQLPSSGRGGPQRWTTCSTKRYPGGSFRVC